MLLTMIFGGTMLISFLLVMVLTRPTQHEKVAQKRLSAIAVGSSQSKIIESAPDDLLKQPLAAGTVAKLDNFLDRFNFYPRLEKLILQAHRNTTPARVLVQSAGLTIAAAVAVRLLYPNLILQIAAPVVALVAPVSLLMLARARRVKQFNAVLADSIELMSRALKAGHSVSSAVEVVADQGQEPVASEFGDVFRSQNFGLPFRNALVQLAERVPSSDLRFLVTAMMVQKETGGNLTEILDRTTHVIRERVRIHGEIKTKTAQGRLTGGILAGLPVFLGLMINIINPGYGRPLIEDPMGKKLLYLGAGMIAIGGFLINRIVQIEV